MIAPAAVKPATLFELADAVAAHLGEGWKRGSKFNEDLNMGENQWRALLINGDTPAVQKSIYISTTRAKGMFYISAHYPDNWHGLADGKHLAINVGLLKTPEQIAKDIARRLLPEYEEAFKEGLTKWAAALDYRDKKEKAKRRVAEITGGYYEKGENNEIVRGKGKTDFQVSGPDSIRFHGHCLYMNVEQLEKIVKAVPELFDKGWAEEGKA